MGAAVVSAIPQFHLPFVLRLDVVESPLFNFLICVVVYFMMHAIAARMVLKSLHSKRLSL